MPVHESRIPIFLQRAAAALALVATHAFAVPYDRSAVTSSFSDFSDYAAGASVNRYDTATRGAEWSVASEFNTDSGPYDQSIVAAGGNNALRLSNAVVTGAVGNQIWSPSVAPAGELGAGLYNDQGLDPDSPLHPPNVNSTARHDGFRLEFDFWSLTGTTQPGLSLTVAAGARQIFFRQAMLGLEGDLGGGLGITIWQYDQAIGALGDWAETVLATGLDPTKVYALGVEILFRDGLNPDGTGNDIVNVYLDGNLLHTGTSWEQYFATRQPFPASAPRFAVDAAEFRAGYSAAPATAGMGFAFDNVLVQAFEQGSPVPEPTSLMLVGAGLAGLGAVRRRTRAPGAGRCQRS